MHTLIIGTTKVRQEIEPLLDAGIELSWAHEFDMALKRLEESDVDVVIFDCREPTAAGYHRLKSLLSRLPVTTRVLAIVEQLPEEEFFSESGVIYLTPPVDLKDIQWFVRSETMKQMA